MSTYNQLLAKLDSIEGCINKVLTSTDSRQWRGTLIDIFNIIQRKDEPSFDPRHPDGIAIDKFADAMKAKMAASRAKGRGGWEDKEQCETRSLREMLVNHIYKGDPVDVGNFAMMLFNRGERAAINDASEMRTMLEMLQHQELSVARAMELIEKWQAGTYTIADLPYPLPVAIPTKEQIELYIKSADSDLGHWCADEWVEFCRATLRASIG